MIIKFYRHANDPIPLLQGQIMPGHPFKWVADLDGDIIDGEFSICAVGAFVEGKRNAQTFVCPKCGFAKHNQ